MGVSLALVLRDLSPQRNLQRPRDERFDRVKYMLRETVHKRKNDAKCRLKGSLGKIAKTFAPLSFAGA
jgi:hypothetical protein